MHFDNSIQFEIYILLDFCVHIFIYIVHLFLSHIVLFENCRHLPDVVKGMLEMVEAMGSALHALRHHSDCWVVVVGFVADVGRLAVEDDLLGQVMELVTDFQAMVYLVRGTEITRENSSL